MQSIKLNKKILILKSQLFQNIGFEGQNDKEKKPHPDIKMR